MDKLLQEWKDHGSYWHKWLEEIKKFLEVMEELS